MREYNKKNIPLAKELRKNMTPWERKLWYQYLSKYPLRFQRQKAIGNYIVDFYCAKARLAIELDGGGHYEQAQSTADLVRTKALEAMGLRVIRICNLDIDKNFRGVCEFLDAEVQKSLPQSAALTAPSSEGALVQTRNAKIFALGFFDGVHLGHGMVLDLCQHLAEDAGAETAAITFDRHPQSLFTPNPPPLLNTTEDRRWLIQTWAGIDHLLIFQVNEQVMGMPWQAFLEMLLQEGAVGFVCGYDFRFGHKGEGNAEKLTAFAEERNLPCYIVDEQTMDGEKISSTRIRALIEKGDMENAKRLLGHCHIFTGKVVPGRQLGRTLGIPTANLHLPEGLVKPAFGVYACRAWVDGNYYSAVTNIGTRPTVDGQGVTVEPWILDFAGDLYGKEITLEFHKFLRPEKKFDSLEELKAEIQKNAEQTRELLG